MPWSFPARDNWFNNQLCKSPNHDCAGTTLYCTWRAWLWTSLKAGNAWHVTCDVWHTTYGVWRVTCAWMSRHVLRGHHLNSTPHPDSHFLRSFYSAFLATRPPPPHLSSSRAISRAADLDSRILQVRGVQRVIPSPPLLPQLFAFASKIAIWTRNIHFTFLVQSYSSHPCRFICGTFSSFPEKVEHAGLLSHVASYDVY